MKTYSLEEYADAVRGSHTDADLQWMQKQLRRGGTLHGCGYKAGRNWRATPEHISEAIDRLTMKPAALPNIPSASSMTRGSRRRLMDVPA